MILQNDQKMVENSLEVTVESRRESECARRVTE